ncbi:9541_t:CDS:2, partial [Funneliformis geosporum]
GTAVILQLSELWLMLGCQELYCERIPLFHGRFSLVSHYFTLYGRTWAGTAVTPSALLRVIGS